MHYAEFAEDEVRPIMTHMHHMPFLTLSGTIQSIALREAIKEYEANKWKVIGQKVGKPAKVAFFFFLAANADQVLAGMRAICKGAFQERVKDVTALILMKLQSCLTTRPCCT